MLCFDKLTGEVTIKTLRKFFICESIRAQEKKGSSQNVS